MHEQLKAAIMPDLSLAETLRDWPNICSLLAERPRRRTSQLADLRRAANSLETT